MIQLLSLLMFTYTSNVNPAPANTFSHIKHHTWLISDIEIWYEVLN